MASGLGIEPELVVVALRALRATLRAGGTGRLRTAISRGRVTWRWEPSGVPPAESEAPASAPGERRKKGKGKRGRADAEPHSRR
jgi:hypothetical protein